MPNVKEIIQKLIDHPEHIFEICRSYFKKYVH